MEIRLRRARHCVTAKRPTGSINEYKTRRKVLRLRFEVSQGRKERCWAEAWLRLCCGSAIRHYSVGTWLEMGHPIAINRLLLRLH